VIERPAGAARPRLGVDDVVAGPLGRDRAEEVLGRIGALGVATTRVAHRVEVREDDAHAGETPRTTETLTD
jgi:hypothetical protein